MKRETLAKQILQLHWQNMDDLSQTEFVAQNGQCKTQDEFDEWLRDVLERRRHECPAGWAPMVCTQDSEHFVLAANPG